MNTNVLFLLGKNGLHSWIWQRISAILLAAYIIFLFSYCWLLKPDFKLWKLLFSSIWMQVFTGLSIVSIILHTGIGMWTVITDYIKCSSLKLIINICLHLLLISYLFFCIAVLFNLRLH